MKRIWKWLGFVTLGLVITLVISAIVVYSYKKEILASINGKLKEMVNGDIKIGDVHVTILRHFPNMSIALENVYLHGPGYEKYHRAFLKADWIDVNLDVMKLFSKELNIKSIHIENGEVFVFRTFDGYTNLEVFKTKRVSETSTAETPVLLDIRKINLQDIAITYVDSLKKKTFGVYLKKTENSITSEDSTTLIHIGGQIRFDGLMLNSAKGSFLKNKDVVADLNLVFDPSSQNILVKPSALEFEKSMVHLSGVFMLKEPGSFQLDITSDQLDYNEGLSILADSLAAKLALYSVEKPLDIKVSLKGVLQPGVKPAIDITFAFNDSKATMGKVNMEHVSIAGSFINHVDRTLPNDDQNSQIHFSKLKGFVDSLPMDAVITLTDLRDPNLQLKAVFDLDLKDLNSHLDTTKIKMIAGHFISTFSYTGKLKEYLDDTRTRYDGVLSGKALITDGKFNYNAKRINVEKLNATFGFNQNQFDIQKLSFTANKNAIAVNGTMTDFIPFFTSPETAGKVKLNITSPRLDITGLLLPRKVPKTKRGKAASKQKVSDMIEKVNEGLEFNLDFKVGEFVNGKFKARQVVGKLFLANNEFIIKNAGMNFAKGNVGLNLKVSNIHKNINPLHLQAKMKDVDIKEFFYTFNNFNQKTFSHEHVDGKLSLDVNLRAEIDDKLNFITTRLDGEASFTIADGRLKDFEPLQRLSNFLLKGRDFSDVQFGEITSDIRMSGTQMHVQRMEVQSTVITMFIEGRYDLKDSSDLNIQIPLSNLKKRDQDFAPENVGTDSKVGASVFLRVRRDKTGKTSISYDPFKRFRKKKKNGNAT